MAVGMITVVVGHPPAKTIEQFALGKGLSPSQQARYRAIPLDLVLN
jgi:hypothetical protein